MGLRSCGREGISLSAKLSSLRLWHPRISNGKLVNRFPAKCRSLEINRIMRESEREREREREREIERDREIER